MAPGKFIGLLFHSRDAMHLAHLQTTSYAEHKALGAYYEGIVDKADHFAEVYFGRNGRVEIVIPEAKNMPAVEHLKELLKIVEAERNLYTSELQNMIDEIIAHINKTLYLLTLV